MLLMYAKTDLNDKSSSADHVIIGRVCCRFILDSIRRVFTASVHSGMRKKLLIKQISSSIQIMESVFMYKLRSKQIYQTTHTHPPIHTRQVNYHNTTVASRHTHREMQTIVARPDDVCLTVWMSGCQYHQSYQVLLTKLQSLYQNF